MLSFRKIVERIQKVSQDSTVSPKKPKIGNMYTYLYDPKTKDKLPYYDIVPLVIPVQYTDNGFYGLNFHYLSLQERNKLLNIILPFSQKNESSKKISSSYGKLVTLASGIWSPCCKRYLWSHIRTKFVHIPKEDWYEIIKMPVISFQRSSAKEVYKQTKRMMKK
jgi:hypothetical protein